MASSGCRHPGHPDNAGPLFPGGSLSLKPAILNLANNMVKHIILWKLKDEFTASEKENIKAGIKEGLESLAGKIPGLVSIKVNAGGLPSSNADVMLDSTFIDEASLKGYAVHPEHVAVANAKVRPFTQLRLCLDFPAE